jgi:hypothetical protein
MNTSAKRRNYIGELDPLQKTYDRLAPGPGMVDG